jgi:hypothetical protein
MPMPHISDCRPLPKYLYPLPADLYSYAALTFFVREYQLELDHSLTWCPGNNDRMEAEEYPRSERCSSRYQSTKQLNQP